MCGGMDPASAKSRCGACSEILSRAVLIFGFTTHYGQKNDRLWRNADVRPTDEGLLDTTRGVVFF
jgi:hypothetical protein